MLPTLNRAKHSLGSSGYCSIGAEKNDFINDIEDYGQENISESETGAVSGWIGFGSGVSLIFQGASAN
jgi:hypothetical protein